MDAATAKQIRTIELPNTAKTPVALQALAFSPDGHTLAAGNVDGTVHLVKVTP
jgi:WD40 repeat protein